MNLLTVAGNLGRDAEVKSIGGSTVCNFSVAMKAGYGQNEQTIWLDCALWGKQAESKLPGYLKKGQFVVLAGELGTREHNGKTYLTLRVANITLGGKSEGNTSSESNTNSGVTETIPSRDAELNNEDMDIPF